MFAFTVNFQYPCLIWQIHSRRQDLQKGYRIKKRAVVQICLWLNCKAIELFLPKHIYRAAMLCFAIFPALLARTWK